MTDENALPGLSGEEIINDLVNQIINRLHRDCNLRESDSYIYGYSGKVSLSLSLYGMDRVEVTAEIETGKPLDEESLEEVKVEVEIPHEPDLQAVRDRAELQTPSLEAKEETPTDITPKAKRKYNRKVQLVPAAGATGEDLE